MKGRVRVWVPQLFFFLPLDFIWHSSAVNVSTWQWHELILPCEHVHVVVYCLHDCTQRSSL